MGKCTRVLWGGFDEITEDRIDRMFKTDPSIIAEAVSAQMRDVANARITMAVKRQVTGTDDFTLRGELLEGIEWRQYGQIYRDRAELLRIEDNTDVIVNRAPVDVFNEILSLAIRIEKPLVSATPGLSDRQVASLYDATAHIPIFRDENLRFGVKIYIDKAIELAKETNGNLTYNMDPDAGDLLPGKVFKLIRERYKSAIGKDLVWQDGIKAIDPPLSPQAVGYDNLVHDTLEIAKVMATKPIKKGKFYDLDEIWAELPH